MITNGIHSILFPNSPTGTQKDLLMANAVARSARHLNTQLYIRRVVSHKNFGNVIERTNNNNDKTLYGLFYGTKPVMTKT